MQVKLNRSDEFFGGKLLSYIHRKHRITWEEAKNHLKISDERLGQIIDLIQENNHIFYNPTNSKGLIISIDKCLMVTSNIKLKKEVLKSLKKKIRELKRTMKWKD